MTKKQPKKRSAKPRSAKVHHEPHTDLLFDKASTRYEYEVPNTKPTQRVEAVWTATQGSGQNTADNVDFKVVIERGTVHPETFSLATFGVQSAYHKVNVVSITPNGATIHLFDHIGTPITLPRELPKLRFSAGVIDERSLYMVSFAGPQCEINVAARGRNRKGATKWTVPSKTLRPMAGHDNMPPGGTVDR